MAGKRIVAPAVFMVLMLGAVWLWATSGGLGICSGDVVVVRTGRRAQQRVELCEARGLLKTAATVRAGETIAEWWVVEVGRSLGGSGSGDALRDIVQVISLEGELRESMLLPVAAGGRPEVEEHVDLMIGGQQVDARWTLVNKLGVEIRPQVIAVEGGLGQRPGEMRVSFEVRVVSGCGFQVRNDGSVREVRRIRLPCAEEGELWLVECIVPQSALEPSALGMAYDLWVTSVDLRADNWTTVVVKDYGLGFALPGPGGQPPGFFFGAVIAGEEAAEEVALAVNKRQLDEHGRITLEGLTAQQAEAFTWAINSVDESSCALILRVGRTAPRGVYQGLVRVALRLADGTETSTRLTISLIVR